MLAGRGGDLGEPVRVGLALVRLAVGEEQQRRAGLGRDPARLLDAAQQAARQVRAAAGAQAGDRGADGVLASDGLGRHDDLHVVSERHEAELVGRVEAIDEPDERLLGRLEAAAVHGAAAVQDDLDGRRQARLRRRQAGGGQLEHDGDLVFLLDGDDIDVEVRDELHRAPPGRGSPGGSRRPRAL